MKCTLTCVILTLAVLAFSMGAKACGRNKTEDVCDCIVGSMIVFGLPVCVVGWIWGLVP